MVVILAAAELFGSKINRELEFTHVPSLGELKARAVGVFNDEIAARKRPGVPAGSFNLHYVQLFDPVGKWVELKSASQLRDYCQIYLFQKDSWNKESQGPIPSPTRPSPIPPQFAAPVNVVPAGLCRTSSPVRTVRSIGTPTRSRLGSPYKRPLQSRAASPAVSPKREARLSNSHPKSPVRHHSPMAGSATAHRLASPAHSVRASSLAAGISKKSLSPHRAGSSASVHLAPVQQSLTHGEKLTLIYTNMLGEKPQVDDDSFRQLFLKTRVNIEPLTITKLFQQADANQDDLLSFGEWERFAELYPTMIEAMYVRIRDYTIDEEQKADCEVFKSVLGEMEEGVHKDQCAVNEADRQTANVQQVVDNQKSELDVAKTGERDSRAVLDASRQETERARGTVNQRAAELAHTQEAQSKQQNMHAEALARVDDATFRAQQLSEETKAAERRLEELRKMVEEQQLVVQMQRDREEQSYHEVDTKNRELDDAAQVVDNAKNESQLALDRLSVSEQALATAQTREEECGVAHLRSRDEVNKQTLKLEEEDQELRMSLDRVAVLQERLSESEGVLNMKKTEYRELCDANASHNLKRDNDEEKEQPLIDQEIRLRQQRISLEEEEARLRSEHRSFQTHTGR